MIQIQNKGKALTEKELKEFERTLDLALPLEYRDFLLSTNGGNPSTDVMYVIDVQNFTEGPTDVQVFFGLSREIKTSNLGWNVEVHSSHYPAGFLPIACDSGGSIFCLALLGEDRGKVFFTPYESEGSKWYLVTLNFGAMLDGLRALK